MLNSNEIMIVGIISLVTILTRFAPFIIFKKEAKTPKFILWLGEVLPYSIMGMLVVYSFKNVSWAYPYALPEIIACTFIFIVHIWKRNSLISIAGGTVLYIVLVQFVFI